MKRPRDHRVRIYRAAAAAAEDLIARIYRIDVSKGLDPLDQDDFLTIRSRLADKLKAATVGAEAEALTAAFETLEVDWAILDEAGRDEIILAARAALAEVIPATAEAVEGIFEKEGGRLVKASKLSAIDRYDLDIPTRFSALDEKVVDYVTNTQGLYVRDAYGVRIDDFDQKARDIVADGLEQGLGRDDISSELQSQLGDAGIARMESYWDNIATIFANRARNFSNLAALDDAGIRYFRVVAVMDEVTSKICRMLDGKVFTVETGLEKMLKADSADHPEAVTRIQPFVSEGENGPYYTRPDGQPQQVADMDESALEAAGISVPPYHGNCRTTIVAEFGPASDTSGGEEG